MINFGPACAFITLHVYHCSHDRYQIYHMIGTKTTPRTDRNLLIYRFDPVRESVLDRPNASSVFIDEHYNCPGAHLSNSAADSHFIANVIAAKVKEKCDYAPWESLQNINHTHKVNVNYWQVFQVEQKAINNLNGTPEEGYSNVP